MNGVQTKSVWCHVDVSHAALSRRRLFRGTTFFCRGTMIGRIFNWSNYQLVKWHSSQMAQPLSCTAVKWRIGQIGTLVNWHSVPMAHQPIGTSVNWHSGPMALRSNGTAVQWHIGQMAQRSNDTLVKWHRGPMVQRQNPCRSVGSSTADFKLLDMLC